MPHKDLESFIRYGEALKEVTGVPVQELKRAAKSVPYEINVNPVGRLAMTLTVSNLHAGKHDEFDP